MNLDNTVALIGILLSLTTALSTALVWYINAEKRTYGLERDINHLKRNYEQMQENLNMVLREIDDRLNVNERDTIRIKSVLNIIRMHFRKEE